MAKNDNAGRKRTSRLRLALIRLDQLRELAKVHRNHGETLDAEAWLHVAANYLSSAPEVWTGSRRGKRAPWFFGLTFENLKAQAEACGLDAADYEIAYHVAKTRAWREGMTKRMGRPFYRCMNLDKVGRLLGVTPETRREARAWNIGAIGETREDREEAAKERDREDQAQRRRTKGVQTWAERYPEPLSKTKPWKKDGISRAEWYRRRTHEEARNRENDAESAKNGMRQPNRRQPNRRPIEGRETAESETYNPHGLPPRDYRTNQPTGGSRKGARGVRSVECYGLPPSCDIRDADSAPKDMQTVAFSVLPGRFTFAGRDARGGLPSPQSRKTFSACHHAEAMRAALAAWTPPDTGN